MSEWDKDRIYKILEGVENNRWSGRIEVETYFGQIKKVNIGSRLDPELSIDVSKFKQTRKVEPQ